MTVKVSYPKTKEERAKLYLHCMAEIKERVTAMQIVLASPMRPLFKQETCYLQLRHICELIAIGCLAAQGDFKTQRAFTEEYSPPKIFKALRGLYPHFFPQPAKLRSAAGQHFLTANNKPDAYNESSVSDLWNRAGAHLHRASVKKYLSTTFRSQPKLDHVVHHINGLVKLLECHVVPIQFEETRPALLNVVLEDGDGGLAAHFLNLDTDGGTMSVESYRAQMVR